MLNDRERKCLEHALSGANENEADNAATMLFRLLRKRGVTVVQFTEGFSSMNGSGAPPPMKSAPDYGMCVFPWKNSKHAGKMFLDIPPSYLRWARDWILEDDERAKKMKRLAEEIEGFLNQAK